MFGSLSEKLAVYYITDDFTEFTGHPAQVVAAMESELIDHCDVVIASARRLVEKKSKKTKPISLVSHGVEYHHFAKALNAKNEDIPQDIKNLKKPIVGFYGEINDWLDLKMLAEAAKKRPDWSFVMIGRVNVNPLKLREYMAAGVPVVSARLPEVLPYKDLVKFAGEADELILAVREFLQEDRSELAPRLSLRVAGESWDGRVEKISGILETAMTQKGVS